MRKSLLTILFFLALPAWGQLTTYSNFNPWETDLTIFNNTGAEIDELAFDLSHLIPGTYALQLGGGGWNETAVCRQPLHQRLLDFSELSNDLSL